MIKLFVSRMKYYLFAIFLLAIQSCSNLEYKPFMTRMTPITPTDIFSHTHNGSLFQEKILLNNGYQPLFEDHRPHNVGDTITIVLQENINASNSSSSDFSKNGSSSFGASIDASPLNSLLNWNLQDNKTGLDSAGKNDFSGRSNNSAKNKFTGLITVTVHKVLPNGNLKVLGEKQVSINKGQELIRFSGIINPNNINQNNLIASTQVADAHIAYLSHGNISDSQEMGWLQKFLLKISPI